MALELPTSGTAPTLMQPESRVALLTCLRRRMEADIAVGDEPRLHAELSRHTMSFAHDDRRCLCARGAWFRDQMGWANTNLGGAPRLQGQRHSGAEAPRTEALQGALVACRRAGRLRQRVLGLRARLVSVRLSRMVIVAEMSDCKSG